MQFLEGGGGGGGGGICPKCPILDPPLLCIYDYDYTSKCCECFETLGEDIARALEEKWMHKDVSLTY